jgi:monothiol glutaredoxin
LRRNEFFTIIGGVFIIINKGALVDTLDKIKLQIADNVIILYMKGTPKMPQCGFSARAVQCIEACGVDFAYVDILANPEVRQMLPQVSDWPTFPQLFVKGELIGGSDIIAEMFQQGELETILRDAVAA